MPGWGACNEHRGVESIKLHIGGTELTKAELRGTYVETGPVEDAQSDGSLPSVSLPLVDCEYSDA